MKKTLLVIFVLFALLGAFECKSKKKYKLTEKDKQCIRKTQNQAIRTMPHLVKCIKEARSQKQDVRVCQKLITVADRVVVRKLILKNCHIKIKTKAMMNCFRKNERAAFLKIPKLAQCVKKAEANKQSYQVCKQKIAKTLKKQYEAILDQMCDKVALTMSYSQITQFKRKKNKKLKACFRKNERDAFLNTPGMAECVKRVEAQGQNYGVCKNDATEKQLDQYRSYLDEVCKNKQKFMTEIQRLQAQFDEKPKHSQEKMDCFRQHEREAFLNTKDLAVCVEKAEAAGQSYKECKKDVTKKQKIAYRAILDYICRDVKLTMNYRQ